MLFAANFHHITPARGCGEICADRGGNPDPEQKKQKNKKVFAAC